MQCVNRTRFHLGGFYCINQDPETLFTHGAAQHAGEVVQVLSFENLHGYNQKPGARVRLRDLPVFWIALEDLQGDNILWDTYCALLEGINMVWAAGAVQHGSPIEFAYRSVGILLQGVQGIMPQHVSSWLGAVVEVR